jgi:ankyrin repeat protein
LTLFSLTRQLLGTQANRDILIRLNYFFKYPGRGAYPKGPSELHLASYHNLPWLVKLCLSQGANPNYVSFQSMGDTPLIWGSEMGSTECITELLKSGADPNQVERDGWSPLHWAARNGHEQVCRLLLLYGAKIDVKDNRGSTPLDWAKSRGYSNIVAALCNTSAD